MVGRIRKYNFNSDFFKQWNSATAYWLGFLFADGCVSRSGKRSLVTNISLKCTDEVHIAKYRAALDSNHNIHYYPNGESKYCLASHRVTSEKFGQDLISLGCVQRKSSILRWPAALPTSLNADFARGYYDGDGCLTVGKGGSTVSFVGTQSFLTSMQSIIRISVPGAAKGCLLLKEGDCYQLQYGGNKSPMSVLDWLYQDSTECIRLDRKYSLHRHHKIASSIRPVRERVEFLRSYRNSDDWSTFHSCHKANCPRK